VNTAGAMLSFARRAVVAQREISMPRLSRFRSVRTHFLLIFFGTAIPLIILTATAIFYVGRAEFRSAQRGLEDTARALSGAVDRELQASIRTLEALGTSELIDEGNLSELHQNVITILPTQPGWRTVILRDASGKDIFHSSFAFGTPRPQTVQLASFDEVINTLRPKVMNYFVGPVTGPTIGVRVPVIRDGEVKYVLTATINAARIDQILHEQRLPDGWYAAVFDRERVQIASSTPNSEANRGSKPGPLISQIPHKADSAWVSGPNRAGIASYGAFVKAPISGFYVGIIVPQSQLSRTLLNSVWFIGLIGLIAAAAGFFLITFYGRLVRHCTTFLIDLAHAIGQGKPVEIVAPAPVTEVNLITSAMAEASALLQRTKAERDKADAERDRFETILQEARDNLSQRNAELRIVTDTMAVGVARFDKDEKYLWVSKRLCEWLGKSPSEIVGRSIKDILDAELYAAIEPRIRVVLSGQPVDFETKWQMRLGLRWIHASYSPTYAPYDGVDGWVAVITDIDARKRAEEALDHLARLTLENPAAVLRANSEGLVTYLNPAAEKIWAQLPPTNREQLPTDLAEAVTQTLDDGHRRELEMYFGDRLFSFLVIPIVNRLYANLYGMDVTDQKAAEAGLREADRRKDEFLAMLGHELRNPLGIISNGVHLLHKIGPSDPKFIKLRDMIARQVTHTSRLLDDLLDVSRMSRGKIQLSKRPCDLRDIVQKTVEDYFNELRENGLKLELQVTDKPLRMTADSTRLAQALNNLLQNARKFTDSGGTVWVSLDAENQTRAVLKVRDNGMGMDPQVLGWVFEPFRQADQSLDRSRGGLGLGLALVKGIVELHGGDVTAASAGRGQGSEFTIRLPLDQNQATSTGGEQLNTPEPVRRRILIIEDNVAAAHSMRMVLDELGHTVEMAHDGAAGINAAQRFRPDVVLCDIGLPGLDGYCVAREIRQKLTVDNCALIAISGYARDKERSREAGFDAHVLKPVDFGKLEALLRPRS
jgi:PAS domain S-box-containing protein